MLDCNVAVFVMFSVVKLSTTRGKRWCKQVWIQGIRSLVAVVF